MTNVFIFLKCESFESQITQAIFLAPIMDLPSLASKSAVEQVWPAPLALSSLQIVVTDNDDISPYFGSPKVLKLNCTCGAYSVDIPRITRSLGGSELLIGYGQAIYANEVYVGFNSISLRGTASDMTNAIEAITWNPPEINGECVLGLNLSKALSDGIHTTDISITATILTLPRLRLALQQGLEVAENSVIAFERILASVTDTNSSMLEWYSLEFNFHTYPKEYVGSFQIDTPDSGTIYNTLVSVKNDGMKGKEWRNICF